MMLFSVLGGGMLLLSGFYVRIVYFCSMSVSFIVVRMWNLCCCVYMWCSMSFLMFYVNVLIMSGMIVSVI